MNNHVILLLVIKNFCRFVVRQHVGRLPAERGDLRETGAPVSGRPQCHGELWHVRVCGHRHVIHTPGGDLLPVCHRYDDIISLKMCCIRKHSRETAYKTHHNRKASNLSLIQPLGGRVKQFLHVLCFFSLPPIFPSRYHGRLQPIWWPPWCSEVHTCGNYLSYHDHVTCLYPYNEADVMNCTS